MLQSTFSKAALCAAGGAVAAMTAAGPAVAAADTNVVAPAKSTIEIAPEKGGGKVHKGVAKRNTAIHVRPSYSSPTSGWLLKGQVVKLKCKVRTQQQPGGGSVWYKLGHRHGWVNARSIHTFDRVPYCTHHRSADDAPVGDKAVGEPVG